MEEVERPRSLSRITVDTNASDNEYIDASESIVYDGSLDLLDTIAETQITLNLFMNNKFDLAEERMAALADRSMYHALGYNSIVFIKAMMTADKKDMERSLEVCKNSCVVIENFRQKVSFSDVLFSPISGKQRILTDMELHAELCYAEALLFRAVLSFFQDDNFTSFIKGAFKIRSCYQIYKSCERTMSDTSVWKGRDPRVKDQFVSGVLMGLGTFNLMLSTLPSKVLRLLEVVGFSGDKAVGMSDLHKSANMVDTLHGPLCTTTLLTWHLVACFMFGAGQPDVQVCHRLLPPLLHKYPNGCIVQYLRARLLLVSSDIESAIFYFNKSITSQNLYIQFHHGCYWELLFAHSYLRQWSKAANYAKKLMNESKWSRSIYTYMMCIFFAADESTDPLKREETIRALASKVDSLRQRIAGKSIPFEKYCARKANRFLRTGSLLFAHYEYIYFWNGFDIIGSNTSLMSPILADIEKIWKEKTTSADVNDRCLYLFLKGVCHRHLKSPYQAEECFREVLESEIPEFTYLAPNATFELALIRIAEGDRIKAEQMLAKARHYKNYPLETKLHFRIHSAMENIGSKTPMGY